MVVDSSSWVGGDGVGREGAFPEPYLLTETENKIIDDILELLNRNGLTLHQSMNALALCTVFFIVVSVLLHTPIQHF